MKREDVLKDMKHMIGNKDPIEFFAKMVDAFDLLFDRLDEVEIELRKVKTNTALAINWEPRVASDMLAKQVDVLRQDKDTYFDELTKLKKAFAEDVVTQDYHTFCNFWLDTLGWHPFLDYAE
jgi:hypothetical protein